jgi:hypothetical protein
MRQRSDCGIVCGGGQAVLEGHELRSLDEDSVVSHGGPPAHVGRRLPRDMDRVAPRVCGKLGGPAGQPADKSASWRRLAEAGGRPELAWRWQGVLEGPEASRQLLST